MQASAILSKKKTFQSDISGSSVPYLNRQNCDIAVQGKTNECICLAKTRQLYSTGLDHFKMQHLKVKYISTVSHCFLEQVYNCLYTCIMTLRLLRNKSFSLIGNWHNQSKDCQIKTISKRIRFYYKTTQIYMRLPY